MCCKSPKSALVCTKTLFKGCVFILFTILTQDGKLISLIFLNLLHFAPQIPIFSIKTVLITINYQSEIIIIFTTFMDVVSLLSLCWSASSSSAVTPQPCPNPDFPAQIHPVPFPCSVPVPNFLVAQCPPPQAHSVTHCFWNIHYPISQDKPPGQDSLTPFHENPITPHPLSPPQTHQAHSGPQNIPKIQHNPKSCFEEEQLPSSAP